MKTTKFVLPVLALLFAIIASFTSSKAVTSPEYYTKDLGNGIVACVVTAGTSCNSSNVNDPCCKFRYDNFESNETRSTVYDFIVVDGGAFTACVIALHHSLNGGLLNP